MRQCLGEAFLSLPIVYPEPGGEPRPIGVINLTDKDPSYPAISYGDIFGRRCFVGLTAHF